MRRVFALILVLAVLSGCGAADAVPQPSLTPAPTAQPTPEPTPSPTPEPTPVPAARRLTLGYESGYEDLSPLSDESDEAAVRLWAGQTVTVRSADGPMEQLYIKWDAVPGLWTLNINGTDYTFGEKGFQHEYVRLPEPCEEFTLTLQSGWVYVCCICAFAEGELPDWVQVWEEPDSQCDLMVVSTHNDDDVLFFGGLAPTYAAERDMEVQVVYLTHHQAERRRPHETLNGLWTMGIRRYPIIGGFYDTASDGGWADSGLYDRWYVKRYFVEMIRRFKPQVIVTQDEKGEYGHPVHVLSVACLQESVLLAADETEYPESAEVYGVWDTPKTYLHLYGAPETRTVMDWDVPLEAFDGMTAFEVAEAAYACHISQHPDRSLYVYPRDHRFTSYEFGLWRSLVGEDREKNELFEHLEGWE